MLTFTYFAEEIMKRDYAACNTFCIHCLLLFGAFTSNFLAELI
jgi:hypothetical protein